MSQETKDDSARPPAKVAVIKLQRAKRYRVHLPIRYRTRGKYIDGVAENVSRGGLFIVAAEGLEAESIVQLELTLPGARTYTVRAEVRHVMPTAAAERLGRKAGAGMMFVETPAGFDAHLAGYLFRLTRREEVAVLVTDDSSELLLRSAGYIAQRAPDADDVAQAVTASLRPILGVVVRRAEAKAYREALGTINAEHLVVPLEKVDQLDETLMVLDRRLKTEAPLEAQGDPLQGDDLEDIPSPPSPEPAEEDKPEDTGRAAAPSESSAPTPRRPASSAEIRVPPGVARAPRPRTPPPRGGASYTFVILCALLAGAVGFAAAFLMYFARPTTHYPRRASRSNCAKVRPCPTPAAPKNTKAPLHKKDAPAPSTP